MMQPDRHDVIRRRSHFGDGREEGLSKGIALSPTLQAGDDVAGENRLVIVKAQPWAQGEFPQGVIILDRMAFDHLRLERVVGVHTVERIEHQIGMIAGDIGGVDDGIDHRNIGLGHKAQHTGQLRADDTRCCQRGAADQG